MSIIEKLACVVGIYLGLRLLMKAFDIPEVVLSLHLRWHLIKPISDERSPSLPVRSVVAMQVGLSSRWSVPSSIGRILRVVAVSAKCRAIIIPGCDGGLGGCGFSGGEGR